MTKEEVSKILNVLFISYPQTFRNWSKEQYKLYQDLWVEAFKDDDANLVTMAVKSIIYSDTRDFAPNIAQVKNKMISLTRTNEVSSLEAWETVRRAISRSGWYAEEEYQKLPSDLQKLVGSPAQLHQWSQMDADTVNSVISSNFQRNYKQVTEKQKEIAMLPNDVKEKLQIESFVKRIETEIGHEDS